MISLQHHGVPVLQLLARRFQRLTNASVEPAFSALDLKAGRRVRSGDVILRADPAAGEAFIVTSGVAGEQRTLADGRRQITALRLPGDIILSESREEVAALCDVDVVDARPFTRLLGDSAAAYLPLRRAWIAAVRLEQAMQRDHIVRLGRLSAVERLAHALAETHDRLLQVGLATSSAFHFPVRQEILSDFLGLSVVHLSRVTQQLRRERLVEIRSSYVSVLDRDGLATLGNFSTRVPSVPDKLSRTVVALGEAVEPRLSAIR